MGTVYLRTTVTELVLTVRLKLLLELVKASTKVVATAAAFGICSGDAVLLNSTSTSASVLLALAVLKASLQRQVHILKYQHIP